MKLILLLISIKWVAEVNTQKFRQEQFPFPPQFQSQNNGFFTSDSTLYLPPESHTSIPYFPMKNVNNLHFPYLPPTGTKAPSIYPTPFPLIISSSIVPNYEEDDDNHKHQEHGRIKLTSPRPNHQKFNQSDNALNPKRDMRSFPQMMYQQPIDRIDVRIPIKTPPPNPSPVPSSPPPVPVSQTPATRRMIISAETHRNDIGLDQIKSAAFPVNQYIGGPANIFVSSTTEPAIPILRLSNEMDLDGSFSYEALGADQTHYVQHSRMENMGSDKEEQVVEGSYSYVGDNGQTYTVHYIADANGFRASGDHLPVPPPVPEIIQRAVQYNLAEEAKRPPHLKSWQDDGKDNSIGESDKNQHYAPPPAPPRNNLFTGRTPEAFSYSYSQGSNTQNNLVAAASNTVPVKTVDINGVDATKSKPNNANGAPISPQITFLASQGAHLPSANTISRMFTTDKPAMPQLINYEAALKEAEENNKALWRWQYGINANNLNQNSNKDTISRSFGEGDDVMINFSDMTPDQYTNMIRSQFEINADSRTRNNYSPNEQRQLTNAQNSFYENQNQVYTANTKTEVHKPYVEYQNPNNDVSSKNTVYQPNVTQSFDYNKISSSVSTTPFEDWYKQQGITNYSHVEFSTTIKPEENKQESNIKPVENVPRYVENKAKLITHHDFPAPSETVTQSYNFDETFYEPQRIRNIVNSPSTLRPEFNNGNDISVIGLRSTIKPADYWFSTNTPVNLPDVWTTSTTLEPFSTLKQNIKFTDFIVPGNINSDFRPISTTTTTEAPTTNVTTTEASVQDIFQNNIFLKNFFNPVKTETKNDNRINSEPKKALDVKIIAEPKTDKIPKFIPYHPKPENEIKVIKKKPLDLSDVLNYVSMKNHFESNKVKARNTQMSPVHKPNNVEHKNEIRFIPIQAEKLEESVKTPEPKQSGFRPLNFDQQEELRGLIKNYKVLQRNHNNMNKYESKELKTELSPPPLNLSQKAGLPPLGRAGPSMKSYLPPIYV